MRRIIVRIVARGLRGGITSECMEEILRKRFAHRDAAWRWEIIGDAQVRNGNRQVRDDYRVWRAGR